MEIVTLAPDRVYLRLALQFDNGHSCSFRGVAHVAGDALAHRSKGRSGEGCELSLSRRDIRYMDHLKASLQYKEALDEDSAPSR